MSRPGLECPVARLHNDALSIVFSAVYEDANPTDQRSSLVAPLTLSHVCRHWRTVALAQSRLWADFYWKAGDNVNAAFALLEMSRSAPMRMSVALHRQHDMTVTAAMLAEGHTVFRAAAAHLHRVTHLRLAFGVESLGSSVLGPFMGNLPCRMPRLRSIDVSFSTSSPSQSDSDTPHPPRQATVTVPQLNITSPPLVSLTLYCVLLKRMRRLVGPETVLIDLKGVNVPYGELYFLLDRTPNLREFRISFCTITGDGLLYPAALALPPTHTTCANGPRVSVCLETISVLLLSRKDIRRLQALMAPALVRAHDVAVHMQITETQYDAAVEFLHVPALANVASLDVARDCVQFRTGSGTAARSMTRKLLGDLHSLAFLRGIFSGATAGSMVSALRELDVSLHCFAELMLLFEAAGASLPVLQRITMRISQDEFLHEGTPENYSGARIVAPNLQFIDLRLSGDALPTAPLVQYYLNAISCLMPYMPFFGCVQFSYNDDTDGRHLPPFCQLYNAEIILLTSRARFVFE